MTTAVHEALRQLQDVVADALYEENSKGGVARSYLRTVGNVTGLNLAADIKGDGVWSPENMQRVVDAVLALKNENDSLRVAVLKLATSKGEA